MKVKTNLRAGSGGSNSGGVNSGGGGGGGGSVSSGGVNGGHGADDPVETPVVYTPPVIASRCVGL